MIFFLVMPGRDEIEDEIDGSALRYRSIRSIDSFVCLSFRFEESHWQTGNLYRKLKRSLWGLRMRFGDFLRNRIVRCWGSEKDFEEMAPTIDENGDRQGTTD
jgi:hypothetical protein